MKTALLTRLGGIGDILILTPVAKELGRRGYAVDLCAGSPTGDVVKLLGNTKLFRNIYALTRNFTGLDVYKVSDTEWAHYEMLKLDYDLVVDYKNSVELNSHYKHWANGPGKEWIVSQNSNYQNWCDIMFSWAGIDPMTIADEDKIPTYIIENKELEWAERLVSRASADYTFAIQMNASSLVRTWYNPEQLPELLKKAYPDKKVNVLFFDGTKWHMLKGKYDFPIIFPDDLDPLRASVALVSQCDLFIGADSGFSHLTEAIGVKSLTMYTTVPSWTRMKYYKNAKAIEPIGDTFDGVKCRPCFVLDRYCPRVRERALKELTPREQKIKDFAESKTDPSIAARELNTTVQGVLMEAEMIQKRYNALLEMRSPCSETITAERIISEVKSICA